jgi:hypothetical protein
VRFERLNRALKQCFVGWRATVQTTAHKNDHALPDKAADLVFTACWQVQLIEHLAAGYCEIAYGVEQGAVEIEGNGFEFHAASLSAWRRLAMIVS